MHIQKVKRAILLVRKETFWHWDDLWNKKGVHLDFSCETSLSASVLWLAGYSGLTVSPYSVTCCGQPVTLRISSPCPMQTADYLPKFVRVGCLWDNWEEFWRAFCSEGRIISVGNVPYSPSRRTRSPGWWDGITSGPVSHRKCSQFSLLCKSSSAWGADKQ